MANKDYSKITNKYIKIVKILERTWEKTREMEWQ
jgi:hypothetical protein